MRPGTDYRKSLDFLRGLRLFGTKLGLNNIKRLLELLDNPQRDLDFYHVAGTNGKGSVSVILQALLRIRTRRVGLFTSPHLEDFRERIRINDRLIPTSAVVSGLSEIRPFLPRVAETPGCSHPTYFEVVTALACRYFRREKIRKVVWEVGLGGRLDATNAVTPRICLITSVSMDHEKYLGPSLKEIAAEKGGIIKNGIPTVLAGAGEEARRVIRDICRHRRSDLIEVDGDYGYEVTDEDESGQTINIRTPSRTYKNIFLPLIGTHQAGNCLTAFAAWERGEGNTKSTSISSIRSAVSKISWPGRFEIIGKDPLVILDGAHNPAGAAACAAALTRIAGNRPLVLILGILSDKDAGGICRPLISAADLVVTVRPPGIRGLPADQLARICREVGGENAPPVYPHKDLDSALNYCYGMRGTPPGGGRRNVFCLTGSLRLVGEARSRLRRGFPADASEG